MNPAPGKLTIVVPVYKEERNVPEFLVRLTPILERLTRDFEIIFALDPSPDRTEEVILEHRARDPRVKLLKFSRRYGQPMATLGGLRYATGDAIIVMDVDLQDPPELIVEMVDKWRAGLRRGLRPAAQPRRGDVDQEGRQRRGLSLHQPDRRRGHPTQHG